MKNLPKEKKGKNLKILKEQKKSKECGIICNFACKG